MRELEREQLGQREAQTYAAAHGNIAALRAYSNSCVICAFKSDAEGEIAGLEREALAQRETQIYFAARGDIAKLTAYVRGCQICAFVSAANTEIQELDEQLNPKVTFQVKSNHPNGVLLSFYSMPGSFTSGRAAGGHTYCATMRPILTLLVVLWARVFATAPLSREVV